MLSAANKEIALFQPIPKERSIKGIKWVEYRPTAQITNKSPIEFVISGTSPDYLLLSKTYLNLKVNITHTDGSLLEVTETNGVFTTENIAMVNLGLSSCFRQVDVSLNQQIINPSVGTNYPYKSYLDVLLKYNHSVKVSIYNVQLV